MKTQKRLEKLIYNELQISLKNTNLLSERQYRKACDELIGNHYDDNGRFIHPDKEVIESCIYDFRFDKELDYNMGDTFDFVAPIIKYQLHHKILKKKEVLQLLKTII